MKYIIFAAIAVAGLAVGCSDKETKEPDDKTRTGQLSAYDETVLKDAPVGYWLLNKDHAQDASNFKHSGTWKGAKSATVTLPNGESVYSFNGVDAYYEIPDVDHLEIGEKGVLTIEAWMNPEVLNFPNVEAGKDYVHWMGKGITGQHAWVARMYNKDSFRENRPQRISGYAFNLEGGLGAGSYFQDVIEVGTWVHYVLVINTNPISSEYPTGYTKLYRDGKLQDQDDLKSYNIVPKNGTAPTRIGTRDLNSFFKGAIGKVAIYNYELSAEKIARHYQAMK